MKVGRSLSMLASGTAINASRQLCMLGMVDAQYLDDSCADKTGCVAG